MDEGTPEKVKSPENLYKAAYTKQRDSIVKTIGQLEGIVVREKALLMAGQPNAQMGTLSVDFLAEAYRHLRTIFECLDTDLEKISQLAKTLNTFEKRLDLVEADQAEINKRKRINALDGQSG